MARAQARLSACQQSNAPASINKHATPMIMYASVTIHHATERAKKKLLNTHATLEEAKAKRACN
jgi:hypothetical protein